MGDLQVEINSRRRKCIEAGAKLQPLNVDAMIPNEAELVNQDFFKDIEE